MKDLTNNNMSFNEFKEAVVNPPYFEATENPSLYDNDNPTIVDGYSATTGFVSTSTHKTLQIEMEFKEACQILEARVSPEQILSIDKGNNFYQFVCVTGGDVATYRVYADGAITVK